MDGAKGWFERRLKEAEVSWCLTRYGGGGAPMPHQGAGSGQAPELTEKRSGLGQSRSPASSTQPSRGDQ